MRRSSIEPKHTKKGSRGQASRIDNVHSSHQMNRPSHHQQQQGQQLSQSHPQAQQPTSSNRISPPLITSSFKFIINRPQAIVIDLLGVLICKSFMTSSKEFREFFQRNILEYLNESWKQKQLKIMINFFRCSQQNVPDEYKLAEREESKEEQIRQAKRHVLWKLRNDPTNSALSLFMLGITEWGYRNKTLSTKVYDEVPGILKLWKDTKIPIYVGVGSADFLVMVLTNTNQGNLLPYFSGHMNIMDFDGSRANKDFKRLATILRIPPGNILYLTRFRQDCKKALESGLQSLIVLRSDFDSHNLIAQLKSKRGTATSVEANKLSRPALGEETVSPPGKDNARNMDPKLKEHIVDNMSSLSLIDDHEENDRYNTQSSQIVEQDLQRYNIVLSLSEITFK